MSLLQWDLPYGRVSFSGGTFSSRSIRRQSEGIDTHAGCEFLSQARLLGDFNPHSGLNVPMHILLLLLSSKLPQLLPHCHYHCRTWFVPVLIFSTTTAHSILGFTGATYVTLSPEYSRPTHRRLRTYVFVGLGLCGAIPTIHSVRLHGLEHTRKELGLDWVLCMAGLYIAGALI